MDRPFSRRQFLGASAGATLLGLATSPVTAADPCEDYQRLQERLQRERQELDRVTTNRNTLQSEIDEYREAIASGRDTARGPHPFSERKREDVRQLAEPLRHGAVFLQMTDGRAVTTASAWFVEENLLLTNSHNVEDLTPASTREAYTLAGEKFTWEVVDRVESGTPDVALLRTDFDAPKVLETGSSDSLTEGDSLVQIGNPGGFGKWVLTLGTFERRDEFSGLVTTVPGLSGVSGSPLFDGSGNVVGMTYAGQPKASRVPGSRPEPGSTDVRTSPMVPDSQGLHVPIEDVLARKEEWV